MSLKTKHQTKKAQLVAMLSKKAGADIKTISEKFGWQPHSARAALSGLRKAGHALSLEKAAAGDAAKYRIIAPVEAGPS